MFWLHSTKPDLNARPIKEFTNLMTNYLILLINNNFMQIYLIKSTVKLKYLNKC